LQKHTEGTDQGCHQHFETVNTRHSLQWSQHSESSQSSKVESSVLWRVLGNILRV
jgi:hypothetical protein